MSIDIKSVEAEAAKEIAAERTAKAKEALKRQLRVVESAEQVVRAEKLKLEDIKSQIQDGTL